MLFFLNIIPDSTMLSSHKSILDGFFSFWFLIAVIELIIIVILVWQNIANKKKYINISIKNKSFSNLKNNKIEDVNMQDVMNNINKSKSLYKSLSKKCHPDKFENSNMYDTALDIFQEISENKHNYAKLNLIKTRAIQELNISFEKEL
jgi:hypothetical protein